MNQIPTPDPSLSTTPDTSHQETSNVDEHGWLPELLHRQARRDVTADAGFSAAVMQMLPPRAEREAGAVAAARRRNGMPGWLATALPWLGLYGLVVAAATLLWLALTLAVMPAAPSLFASGALGAKEELVNFLVTALERWLAPALILGWLAWWLHQQEWLME
jgi:hypothetical protein